MSATIVDSATDKVEEVWSKRSDPRENQSSKQGDTIHAEIEALMQTK